MGAGDRLRAAGRLDDDVVLGPLTTYKFGGPARHLVTVDGADDVRDAYALASEMALTVRKRGTHRNRI